MRAMEAKQVDRSKKYNKRNFFSIPRPTLRIRRILKMPEVSGKVLRIIMVRILRVEAEKKKKKRVEAGWTGTFLCCCCLF